MATNTEKIVVQVVVKGERDLNNLNNTTKKATKGVGGLVKQYGLLTAGILGSVAAFRQINRVLANSVRTFRDFEFQMSKVKAITGASEGEIKKLNDTALELGRTTFFTAQQVAELQTNFGKLGFTTQEILDAQEATLQLATATDSDLARAAIVAGAAVRGFGLDASETQRVVDVMAVAFTSSALDIEKFQTSMTKVAPIAKAAGFSIEDTTSIMAQLADSGIEASIAGTSLRNILLKMQDPNSDLVKSFGKTIHSLDELVPALTKFSEEGGSLAEIMEVVDLRQAAAFEQMITSRERTVALRDALLDANGAAEKMADIVGDNLEGAFKRFNSAIEGLQIAIIGERGGFLQHLVDQLAKAANAFTKFLKPQETQIEFLEKTKVAIDNELRLLLESNLGLEERKIVINRLNTSYGTYLPNLITEKTSLEDIRDIQREVNQAFNEKIIATALEKELTKLLEEQATAVAGLAQSNVSLAEAELNRLETDPAKLASMELQKQFAETAIELNEGMISSFEEENEKILKGFETVAKNMGVNFKNVLDIVNKAMQKNTEVQDKNKKSKKNLSAATNELTIFQKIQKDLLEETVKIQEKAIEKREGSSAVAERVAEKEMQLIMKALDTEKLTTEERTKLKNRLHELELKNIDDEIKKREELRQSIVSGAEVVVNSIFEIEKNAADRRFETERELLKARLEQGLISQETFEKQMTKLDRLAFRRDKNAALGKAAMETALNIIKAFGEPVQMALAALTGSTQMAVIQAQQFAHGGLVHGKSHANGGEKFAVGGRVVELEGGEAVINKRSTSMFRSQLSAINQAGGGVKFADGGLLNMPSFATNQFNAVGMNGLAGAMSQGGRVYVLESDITNTQNNVSLIQSQAGF